MRGYWFNQRYGYLTNAATVKFNRKYIGIPFKQQNPFICEKYNISGKFNGNVSTTRYNLSTQYTISGKLRYAELQKEYNLCTQYNISGKINGNISTKRYSLCTQYNISGKINYIE